MSSDIYYLRAYIRVDDKFIPLVCHGASNCFEFDDYGREIAEKCWDILNYSKRGQQIFSEQEICEIAEKYEEINTNNRGGICICRNRSFRIGQFKQWIIDGMEKAHTVEEYCGYGNELAVFDCSNQEREKHEVYTTEQLKETLSKLNGKSISISFLNKRNVILPPSLKPRAPSVPTDYSRLPEFFVLKGERGYFVKRSTQHVWFSLHQPPTFKTVRKFKTRKDAERYLEKNSAQLYKYSLEVERVENGGSK